MVDHDARGLHVHLLLTDPTTEDRSTGGFSERPTLSSGALCLLGLTHIVAAATSVALVAWDYGDCYNWNGQYYHILPLLACFSAIPGCGYCWLALLRPRPKFVHVAGRYFLASTLQACFLTMRWSYVCTGASEFKYALEPGMVMQFLAVLLLQQGTLLKVEALLGSQAKLLRGLVVGIVILGAPIVIVQAGLVYAGFPLWVQDVSAVLMFCMVFLFTAFTGFAAFSILRCRELVRTANISATTQERHCRTLAVHAIAIVAANGTLLIYWTTVAVCLAHGVEDNTGTDFVMAHILEHVTNTVCMVFMSGLISSAIGTAGRDDPDVISEIAEVRGSLEMQAILSD